jgi:hypothetical protein
MKLAAFLLVLALPSSAQVLPQGILQSVSNAAIQPAGDRQLVTRQSGSVPIGLTFTSCQGIGMDRDRGQWWVMPIGAPGNSIAANTNLWVLPEDPHSADHSWYIKLPTGASLTATCDQGLKVRVDADRFELYQSEARPHSDTFNHRFSLQIEGGEEYADTLAGFYWGTMLPSVVERTKARDYLYHDGYVISTLNPRSYAGSYPSVDHEFQIKGRLAFAADADLDVARRMIELQFKLMQDDPEKLFRDPTSVQPNGVRQYHVRRDSQDHRENADMFLVTGNIEVLEESFRYLAATHDTAWLARNIVNLENAASWTIANTDQYGRVWSDVYYEDQVIKDGRVTQAQAFAAYTFGLLSEMEAKIGRTGKSTYYAGLSKKLATALVQPLPMGYWDEKSQRFVDWIDRGSRVHDHIHLLSNMLPVLFGYATAAQTKAARTLIEANLASFERFPSFVAADIAAYTNSEIGTGGPYDLAAAGRYWYWDATFWTAANRNPMLAEELTAVAREASSTQYYMGERYDMDHIYYVDGKKWHGAEMYYEYPCVFSSVLITDLLGLTSSIAADVAVKPHLHGFGTVEFTTPKYDLTYTYAAGGFTLKNLATRTRRFEVDLSALYSGVTRFKLPHQIAGPTITIELAPRQAITWVPVTP